MSKVKKVIVVLLFCTYIGFPIAFGLKTAKREVTLEYHQMYERLNRQAFADFDENGKLDVLTTEYNSQENTEALALLSDVEDFDEDKENFIENEDGFIFLDEFYTTDFNGDGNQDVFLVKDYRGIEYDYRPNDYLIYEGNGYGSFPENRRNLINDSFVKDGNVLEVGDFNGDGKGDFLVNKDGNTTIGLQQDQTDGYEFAWENISYNVINAITIDYNEDSIDDLLIVHREKTESETRAISIIVSQETNPDSYQWAKKIKITGNMGNEKNIVPAFMDYNGDSHKDVVFIREDYQENTDFYVYTSNEAHTEYSKHLETEFPESIDIIIVFPPKNGEGNSRIFAVLYKIGYYPASGFLHNGLAPNYWGVKEILYGLTWIFGGMILFSTSLNKLFDTLVFHKAADLGKLTTKNRRRNDTIMPFLILLVGGPILALQGFVPRPDWTYNMFQFWGGFGGYIFLSITTIIYLYFCFTPLKKFWDSIGSPIGKGKKTASYGSKKLKTSSNNASWGISSSKSSQPFGSNLNIGKATYRENKETYKQNGIAQNKQGPTYKKSGMKTQAPNAPMVFRIYSVPQSEEKQEDLFDSTSSKEKQKQELNRGKATFKKAPLHPKNTIKKPKILGETDEEYDEKDNRIMDEYDDSDVEDWFEESDDEDDIDGW